MSFSLQVENAHRRYRLPSPAWPARSDHEGWLAQYRRDLVVIVDEHSVVVFGGSFASGDDHGVFVDTSTALASCTAIISP